MLRMPAQHEGAARTQLLIFSHVCKVLGVAWLLPSVTAIVFGWSKACPSEP